MFLLDTNVVSELNRPRPEARVKAWVAAQSRDALFVSAITLAEIVRGIGSDPDEIRRTRLQEWMVNVFDPWLRPMIIPVTAEIAERTGQLASSGIRSGRPTTLADAAIAATAIDRNLILVTRNVRDFAHFAVEVFNPWNTHQP